MISEGNGEDLPPGVQVAVDALRKLDVPFVLSQNEPAGSCPDAASKRHRRGRVGIPLHDEMKSLFCATAEGKLQSGSYVIAHCRGDMRVDFHKLQRVANLSSKPHLLPRELLIELGLDFGLVNPLEHIEYALDGIAVGRNVQHAFDSDLLVPVGLEVTVMTNAGHREWAVEFEPSRLIKSLRTRDSDRVFVGSFALPDPKHPRTHGA